MQTSSECARCPKRCAEKHTFRKNGKPLHPLYSAGGLRPGTGSEKDIFFHTLISYTCCFRLELMRFYSQLGIVISTGRCRYPSPPELRAFIFLLTTGFNIPAARRPPLNFATSVSRFHQGKMVGEDPEERKRQKVSGGVVRINTYVWKTTYSGDASTTIIRYIILSGERNRQRS